MNGRKRKESESQGDHVTIDNWMLSSGSFSFDFLNANLDFPLLMTLILGISPKPGTVLNVLCALFHLIFEDKS